MNKPDVHRDHQVNEDRASIEEALGPQTPEMRCAIRWAAYRAAARELRAQADLLLQRAGDLEAREQAEQASVLKLTSGDGGE